MTIEKGRPWGETAPLPPDGIIAASDAEAGAAVTAAITAGRPLPVIGLAGGDLCRTVGGTGDVGRMRSGAAATFPVDLGVVVIDGERRLFVAHVVARSRLWTSALVAMNAQWLGAWNVAPRAHPNDGRLDVYRCHLRLGDLRKLRARVRLGAHLPHPRIEERRVTATETTLDRAVDVWVDGVHVGKGRRIELSLESDALRVVI